MCTDIVVYDLEIAKSVEDVGGWDNVRKGQAGISFAVSYSYKDAHYRVFGPDNLVKLKEQLEAAGLVVGFNHMNFDNTVLGNVLNAPLNIPMNYDILRQIQKSTGAFCKGYKLEQVCERTLGENYKKDGDGAMAPVLYKDSKYGELISYCMKDVYLTKQLFDFIHKHGYILDANNTKLPVVLPEFKILRVHV
jgi:DEAD/DEAH box helicase domain-containing protein